MKTSVNQLRRQILGAAFCAGAVVGVYLLTQSFEVVEHDGANTPVVAPVMEVPRASATAVPADKNTPAVVPAISGPRTSLFEQHEPEYQLDPRVVGLEENIERAQGYGTSFDRWEAIGALGESDEAIAEDALRGLLYDHNPSIREAAVEALGALATPGAIGGLSYALVDTNPAVRTTAIELLADIGTSAALEALAMVLNDPDTDLRLAAVYELADHENVAATVLLQQFLLDADSLVREVAAESMRD